MVHTHVKGMEFAIYVFVGNILTLSVVWGFNEFRRKDVDADWVAYGAFILPLLLVIATLLLGGDASTLPQFAASGP